MGNTIDPMKLSPPVLRGALQLGTGIVLVIAQREKVPASHRNSVSNPER